jgi:phosphoribosyl-ATP pyrophosphohydrolase
MSAVFDQLYATLLSRKNAAPDTSYVAGLYAEGLNKILAKIGEEAIETLLAVKDVGTQQGRAQVIHETADLWFHILVMLAQCEITPDEVLMELERRMGQSGLAEKVSRTKH